MTRRILLASLVGIAARSATPSEQAEAAKFPDAWNEWAARVRMVESPTDGEGIGLWFKLKNQWEVTRKFVDKFYGIISA